MLKEEGRGLVCDCPDTAAALPKLFNLVFSLAWHLEDAFSLFPLLSCCMYMNVWSRRDLKEQGDTPFFKINLFS